MATVSPIEQFILSTFKVRTLEDVNPWGLDGIHCWESARDVTIHNVFTGPGTSLITEMGQPRQKYKEMDGDLGNVIIRNFLIRYATNPSPSNECIVRLNYYHKVFETAERAQDKMIEAMGGIPKCLTKIPAGFNGAQDVYAMRSSNEVIYMNEGFVKTMAHLNEKNIFNGTHKLDPSLCGELPKTYTLPGPEGVGLINEEAEYYVLIPHNHVLSWKLQVLSRWREKNGLYALELRVIPKEDPTKPYILYYVVPNLTFDRLMLHYLSHWCGKVDIRPLESVGLEISQPGATLQATINYTCFPPNIPVDQLLPSLATNFIPYSKVLEWELNKQ